MIPYVLHRLPAYWDDPEQFEPERFSPDLNTERFRFLHVPFGAGPRQCIGNHFAVTEMLVVVATLAQQFQLRLVPGHHVEPHALITLHPRFGMPMSIERRH